MPNHNTPRLCFIGFGEAGQAIASGLRDTMGFGWGALQPMRRGAPMSLSRR